MEDEFPDARLPVVESAYTLNTHGALPHRIIESMNVSDLPRMGGGIQRRIVTSNGEEIEAFVCVEDDMTSEPTIYYIPKSTITNSGRYGVDANAVQMTTPQQHQVIQNKQGHYKNSPSATGKKSEMEEKKTSYETETAKLNLELQQAKLNLLKVESNLRKKEMEKKDREILLLNRQMSKIDMEIMLMERRHMYMLKQRKS